MEKIEYDIKESAELMQKMFFFCSYAGKAHEIIEQRLKEPKQYIKDLQSCTAKRDRKNAKYLINKTYSDIRKDLDAQKSLISTIEYFEEIFTSIGIEKEELQEMFYSVIDSAEEFCEIFLTKEDRRKYKPAILLELEEIKPNCVIIDRKPYEVICKTEN